MIQELEEEKQLNEILNMVKDKDIILVEGYKKSNLRKIEVYREGLSEKIISDNEKIISIASDVKLDVNGVNVLDYKDYVGLCDLIEKEENFDFENYQ